TNADADAPLLGPGVNESIQFARSDTPFVSTVPGSRWAFATAVRGARPEVGLYVAPLETAATPGTRWTRIAEVDDGVAAFDARGDDVFLLSHLDAPRSKVLHVRADHPDLVRADVLRPQGAAVITGIAAAADGLFVQE